MTSWKRTVICLLAFACSPLLFATHIIGGVMTYTHVGADDYLITLKLYRDCGPANSNGTGFDPSATVGFFDSNGSLFTSLTMNTPVVTPVPAIQTNPCLIPPPLCVEEGVYTGTVNIVVPPGGLTLAYQRCCRNPTVLNIQPQQGLTLPGTRSDQGHLTR